MLKPVEGRNTLGLQSSGGENGRKEYEWQEQTVVFDFGTYL